MSTDKGYGVLRRALERANVTKDAQFEFVEKTEVVAATTVKQLQVRWKDGNEYLRVDRLLESLRQHGDVDAFEYYGRGRGEAPKLVADVKLDGQSYQLIYFLPQG